MTLLDRVVQRSLKRVVLVVHRFDEAEGQSETILL